MDAASSIGEVFWLQSQIGFIDSNELSQRFDPVLGHRVEAERCGLKAVRDHDELLGSAGSRRYELSKVGWKGTAMPAPLGMPATLMQQSG